ncbi:TIGR02996 domain-containing protein [Frigoriglobus tundricola]|uniref:TIGR02996 domain-containing protein n=1 Tax=Frigoriglobus tundricola TaxID=2774151 RepID=A0A6M5YYX3_9BACT|nr:TIGR02996 domain-containing protein [Frigoriglobus tundricola]QJW99229.1 hypothetical protein FTUN_6831 [Frigoriglobus tundricola]
MSGVSGGFLDYIVANIDEDTPRLAFADWHEEHDRPERAEFIRVQVQRARLPAWDAAQIRLRIREQELLIRYGEQWLAEVPVIEGARWEGFRRGVVAEVSFASYEAMRKGARACRAVAPVEAVTVRWPRRREGRQTVDPIAELRELTLTGNPDYDAFDWVAESPQLSTLRTLTVRSLWGDSLARLVASPHLTNLKSLRLPSNNLGNPGLRAISQAATLTALEELDFSSLARHERYIHDPVIRAAGMRALMDWPGMASVRTLNLNGNDMSRDGLRALLRSPHAAGIKALSLRDTRLDGQALGELDAANSQLRLDVLDLGQNVLKDLGAESVALAPCLRELKALRLDRCEIRLSGARLFVKKAFFLNHLRTLDVGHNHFGSGGLEALLARGPEALHTLHMRDNDLFDGGAEVLAESPASNGLVELDLSQNQLKDAAARTLGRTGNLQGLLVLRLADNAITGAGAAALRSSPLGRRLGVLEFLDEPPAPPPRDEPAPTGPPELPPFEFEGGDPIPF